MCSACARSSPSAVNTAAEQSARSLMLGLYAARRSTAPISSATPARRETSTCSAAGSSALIDPPGGRSTRRARPVRRANLPGSRWWQSGSATTAGPVTATRSTGGSVVDRDRDRPARPRPDRDHLDRGVGPIEAVAAPVLGVEVVDLGHGELVALAGVAAVEQPLDLDRRLADRARPPRSRGRTARSSSPARSSGAGHERTSSRWRGRAHEPDRRQHTGARRDHHRGHAERVGDGARVQRAGATERHQRQRRAGPHPVRRSRPGPHVPSRRRRRRRRPRGRRRRAASAERAASRSRRPSPENAASGAMRPSARSASVTVGCAPPRP